MFLRLYCCLLTCLLAIAIQAQDQPEIVLTNGHISKINCLDFSPNNQFVATAGLDKTIRIWSRSLQQEYRVLYGHTFDAAKLKYTSDGKYLVSMSRTGELIVWQPITGEMVYRTDFRGSIMLGQFVYVPNTTTIILGVNGGLIKMDILTGKKTVLDYKTSTEFHLSQDAKYLFVSNPTLINSINIIDYSTLKKVGEVQTEQKNELLQYLVSSNDNQYLAAFTATSKTIVIWERANQNIKHTIKISADYKETPIKLLFSKNKDQLFVLNMGGSIVVYDCQTGKIKNTINPSGKGTYTQIAAKKGTITVPQDMSLSEDGTLIGMAAMVMQTDPQTQGMTVMTAALLFDTQTGKQAGILKGYYKTVNHLGISANSKYLITSLYNRYNGLRIWNVKTGELERFIPTSGTGCSSRDGSRFAAWVISEKDNNYPILTVFNSNTLEPIFEAKGINTLRDMTLSDDGRLLVSQEVKLDSRNPMNNEFYATVWDVNQQKRIGKIEFDAQDTPFPGSAKISRDHQYFLASTNSTVSAWSLATGKLINSTPLQIGYDHLLDFVPETNQILVSKTQIDYSDPNTIFQFGWFAWDYLTDSISDIFKSGKNGVLFCGEFSPDGQYFTTGQGGYHNQLNFVTTVWDWKTKAVVCTLQGHTGNVTKVVFDRKQPRLYTTSLDGFIKIWDWEKCTLNASMIAYNQLDYIILSPNNYYKTSKGQNQGIGFRYKEQLYTFDQFDIRFNQPHRVLADLGVSKYSTKIYEKAWLKRLKKVGFTPEDLEGEIALPTIQVAQKTSVPLQVNTNKLELQLTANDPSYNLDRLLVYINDVPVPQLQGIALSGNQLDTTITIQLSAGKNLVKLSVVNSKGLESLRETFEIAYTSPQPKAPNLYILTVGVSEFEQVERNLKFAKKDGQDLVKKMKKSNYFDRVKVLEYYNEKATKASLITQATEFLATATLEDQVLIYISSHGLLDTDLNYYLAMYDTDFDDPASAGLPYEAISDLLDNLTCRNRLVLIDACHSGEVDTEDVASIQRLVPASTNVHVNNKSGTTMIRPKTGLKNSFAYMKTLFNDLAIGTGATVISAAGGFEFALESDDWNNGVFTYAFLEGLQSGNADLNRDGLVRVSEIKSYVMTQVDLLTEGKQHPTTRGENNVTDPVLFKIR